MTANIDLSEKQFESRNTNSEEDKISIEGSCRNNENAFISGQIVNEGKKDNNNMKTDRLKIDNDLTTSANGDIVEGKNVYNLQHSKPKACTDARNDTKNTAKDILLPHNEIPQGSDEKEGCKWAGIKKLLNAQEQNLSNDFPPCANIDSRTSENGPTNDGKQTINQGERNDVVKKMNDKNQDCSELIDCPEKDTCKNASKLNLEDTKVNTASICKTSEVHAVNNPDHNESSNKNNDLLNTGIGDRLFEHLSSDTINAIKTQFEKNYDTHTIKEELHNLKKELEQQIDQDSNCDKISGSSIENGGFKIEDSIFVNHSPEQTKSQESPEQTASSKISSIVVNSPKPKKNKLKGKITKTKKKESTLINDLPSKDTNNTVPVNITDPEVKMTKEKIVKTNKYEAGDEVTSVDPTDLIHSRANANAIPAARETDGASLNPTVDQKDDFGENIVAKKTVAVIAGEIVNTSSSNIGKADLSSSTLDAQQEKFCKNLISAFIQAEEKVTESSSDSNGAKVSDILASDSCQVKIGMSSTKQAVDVNYQGKVDIVPKVEIFEATKIPADGKAIERKKTPTPTNIKNFIKNDTNEETNTFLRPTAFFATQDTTGDGLKEDRLRGLGKSLDEEDVEKDKPESIYKTSRSKSMASVDVGGAYNHHTVPQRWQKHPVVEDTITETEVKDNTYNHPPRKVYSPVKEYNHTPSTTSLLIDNKTKRKDDLNVTLNNVKEFKHSLSVNGVDDRGSDKSAHTSKTMDRNEKSHNGVIPQTAYQQYTIARSRTSLHLNSFAGNEPTTPNKNTQDTDSNPSHNTVSPTEAKRNYDESSQNWNQSKIPPRYLKRMTHTMPSTDKPPISSASSTPKNSVVTIPNSFSLSPPESALQAKIRLAKEEHSNACQDARKFGHHSKTLPSQPTSTTERYVSREFKLGLIDYRNSMKTIIRVYMLAILRTSIIMISIKNYGREN